MSQAHSIRTARPGFRPGGQRRDREESLESWKVSLETFPKICHNKTASCSAGRSHMERYRSGRNELDSKSCDPFIKTAYFHTETYRSGRNELDSKSSCPQGHVGSNPTVSAIKPLKTQCFQGLPLFLNQFSDMPKTQNGAHGARACGARPANEIFGIFLPWCPNGARHLKSGL